MTVTRETYLQESFEVPTEERWGLSPDEQMVLFGDPGQLDKYSREAFKIMLAKYRLSVRYLESFWPRNEIPQVYIDIMDEMNERHRALIEKDSWHARHPAITNPLWVPISADLADKYTWKERDIRCDGAATQAVEYATLSARSGSDTEEALTRLEYVLKISREENDWGWRGSRSGGAWVELPTAPWHNRLEQFPMRMVDEEKLF